MSGVEFHSVLSDGRKVYVVAKAGEIVSVGDCESLEIIPLETLSAAEIAALEDAESEEFHAERDRRSA